MSEYGDMASLGAKIVGGVALAFGVATTAIIYPALDHETDVKVTDAQHEVLTSDKNLSYDDLDKHLQQAANEYFRKKGYKCDQKPAPETTGGKILNTVKYWDDNSQCKPTRRAR